MKIGLSTSVVQRGRTGVGEYVFALTRALATYTATHRFILFVLEKDLPLFEFARKSMEVVPVAEQYRPPVRDILWHQTQLVWLAHEHQLDVLHVPSYRRMMWSHPCALVATIHDLASFRVARKYDRLRMFYGRVVARLLAWRQDELIAVSQTTARDIEKFWKLPAERVSVIRHGLDHERFSPAPPGIAKAVGRQRFDLEKPFFLYVARLEHPAKNHVRLITAFEQFKAETKLPWQLVLAGSDWHGAEVIHDMIKRSPFHNDVRSLGFVSEEDLPMLYRAADVFVFPSLYEGFGLPPLEAMACGCPVLSSTRGALGEMLGNAAAVVDPEDTSALRAQLTRLATDEQWRRELSAAGLQQARNFHWSTTAAQTIEVYSRAVRRAKSYDPKLALAGEAGHG